MQDLPPALQRILSRCLEKKPERRFQHASDLGFALEALSDASGTAIAAPPQAGARTRWIWIAAALAAVAVAAALFVWWRQPPAVPVVEAATQLTSDGEVKANGGRLETDGSRVYFSEGTLGSYRIMQVAATGGPTAIIPTRLANFQFTALSQGICWARRVTRSRFLSGPSRCPAENHAASDPSSRRMRTYSRMGAFSSAWETTLM